MAVCALAAASPALGRRARSTAAVLGLITASAVIVHLSGGVVEAHFHFFVMIGVITLYQDWLLFGLALGYVVVHHSVLGLLAPHDVFNHAAAVRSPWKWALIHGAFVLAASVAYLVNWRLSERQAVEISRLVSRLEGLARTDPLTGVPNRRVWEEELPRELERARRMGTGLCLAMIDLDNFKDYNDRHGHQAGDLVLKEAASAWRAEVRSDRPAGPLRRGGVRAPAAGVRARRRGPDRGAAAARHPAGDLLGGAGPLGLPGGQQPAGRAGRPGPVRGQGRGPQPPCPEP